MNDESSRRCRLLRAGDDADDIRHHRRRLHHCPSLWRHFETIMERHARIGHRLTIRLSGHPLLFLLFLLLLLPPPPPFLFPRLHDGSRHATRRHSPETWRDAKAADDERRRPLCSVSRKWAWRHNSRRWRRRCRCCCYCRRYCYCRRCRR